MQTPNEMIPPVRPPEPPSSGGPPFDGGSRVILHGVSWETYERLLDERGDSHAAHFAYDQGELEIMVPSEIHEEPNRTLATLIEVLAEELNIDLRRLGSTTFRRDDLHKGFEPDSCFYIQNETRVRGKVKLDLTIDPPPDLIIEIDVTSPSLNKFPIYAKLGIPELWRYKNNQVQIFALINGQYVEVDRSIAFPLLTNVMTTQFITESAVLTSTLWLRRVRQWVREAGDVGK